MELKKQSTKTFSGVINIGLEIGYESRHIDKGRVIRFLQDYQDKLIGEKNINLSCSVTESEIVFSGQVEKHLRLSFINYPKFPMEEYELKKEIESLARVLMGTFHQNRIVIEYLDETVMLEKSEDIDPRIYKKS